MSRGTGTGLVMIAIGAILAFAVTTTVGFLDLQAVGWILMVMGMVGFVTVLYLDWASRRTSSGGGYDQNFVGRNYDDGSTYQQQTYQPQNYQPPRY